MPLRDGARRPGYGFRVRGPQDEPADSRYAFSAVAVSERSLR